MGRAAVMLFPPKIATFLLRSEDKLSFSERGVDENIFEMVDSYCDLIHSSHSSLETKLSFGPDNINPKEELLLVLVLQWLKQEFHIMW